MKIKSAGGKPDWHPINLSFFVCLYWPCKVLLKDNLIRIMIIHSTSFLNPNDFSSKKIREASFGQESVVASFVGLDKWLSAPAAYTIPNPEPAGHGILLHGPHFKHPLQSLNFKKILQITLHYFYCIDIFTVLTSRYSINTKCGLMHAMNSSICVPCQLLPPPPPPGPRWAGLEHFLHSCFWRVGLAHRGAEMNPQRPVLDSVAIAVHSKYNKGCVVFLLSSFHMQCKHQSQYCPLFNAPSQIPRIESLIVCPHPPGSDWWAGGNMLCTFGAVGWAREGQIVIFKARLEKLIPRQKSNSRTALFCANVRNKVFIIRGWWEGKLVKMDKTLQWQSSQLYMNQ